MNRHQLSAAVLALAVGVALFACTWLMMAGAPPEAGIGHQP